MAVFDALVSTGLDVRDCRVPGYAGKPIAPRGVLVHHTASPAGSGDLPSLGVCLHGRTGLSGPLCQVLIGRAGTVAVITDGRANHAGEGAWPGIGDGNGQLIGVELENDGVGEPWSPGVLSVAVRVVKALCRHFKVDLVIGHKEWTRRKIDPSFDMDWFRAQLRSFQPANQEEPEMELGDRLVSYRVDGNNPSVENVLAWTHQQADAIVKEQLPAVHAKLDALLSRAPVPDLTQVPTSALLAELARRAG